MKIDSKVTNNASKFARSAAKKIVDPIKRALNKAGGVVKREAQRGLESRRQANALKVISRGNQEVRVGFKKKSAGWYGKFGETGTKQHEIVPKDPGGFLVITPKAIVGEFKNKKGKVQRLKVYSNGDGSHSFDARKIIVKKVNHPGMRKKPVLIPAGERKRPEVKEIIADAVVKVIQQSVKDV